MATLADGFVKLLAALDKLEIQYSIGGSVASSVHGIPRTTMDVDVIADLKLERVDELAEILQPEFYADRLTMREALARGRSFNVIHIASAYKFDIFPLARDEYSRTEFNRRSLTQIVSLSAESIECLVASPEDTILRKLEWYRAGGESSERQWNDLRGIVQVRGDRLDQEYLHRWAKVLKVEDLLEKLSAETP